MVARVASMTRTSFASALSALSFIGHSTALLPSPPPPSSCSSTRHSSSHCRMCPFRWSSHCTSGLSSIVTRYVFPPHVSSVSGTSTPASLHRTAMDGTSIATSTALCGFHFSTVRSVPDWTGDRSKFRISPSVGKGYAFLPSHSALALASVTNRLGTMHMRPWLDIAA